MWAERKAQLLGVLPPSLRRLVNGEGLGGRMARGAFWSVVSSGVNRVIGMVVSIFIARLLGKILFGEMGIIQSTLGVFGLVAGFGTSLTATRYVAELRHKDPERAGRIIGMAQLVSLGSGALSAIALLFSARHLAEHTLSNAALRPLLMIGAAILLIESWNGAKSGSLAGLEAFRSIAIVDLFAGTLGAALTVAGVVLFALPGAIGGLVAGLSAHSIGYSIALRREAALAGIPLWKTVRLDEWRVLWKFSFPALLAAGAAAFVNWGCRAVLVNEPDGYAQMGLFNAANQWRTAILFLPGTIGHSFLPVLSNMVGNRDRRGYLRILATSITVNGTLALVAAVAISLASRMILRGYGPEYASARGVLVLLAGAAVLAAMVGMVGQAIISAGFMWGALLLNGIWAAVLFASLWHFRSRGAYGFALANLIAYGVHFCTSVIAYFETSRRLFGAEPAVAAKEPLSATSI